MGRRTDDDPLTPDPPRAGRSDERAAHRPIRQWWLIGLLGGIGVTVITAFRMLIHLVIGRPDDVGVGESVLDGVVAFGIGFLFGLVLWGVQWLKWRFARYMS